LLALSLQQDTIREDGLNGPALQIVADTQASEFRRVRILYPGGDQCRRDDDRAQVHPVERCCNIRLGARLRVRIDLLFRSTLGTKQRTVGHARVGVLWFG